MAYFGDEDVADTDEAMDSAPETDQAAETPPSEAGEGETEDSAEPKTGAKEAAPTAEDFDLDGVQFKGLTKDQLEAIRRGVSLNKDYTTGKQALAAKARELNNVIHEVQTNPIALRKYFSQEHLIAALGFDPRSANAQKPGQASEMDTDFSEFTPEAAKVLKGYQQALTDARQEIGNLRQEFGQFGQKFQTIDQEKATVSLEREVSDAMSKFPILNQAQFSDYNRRLILMSIAADPSRSAIEIANDVSKAWASGNQATMPKNAPANTTKVVGPGGSVPLAQKQPKTMEDAAQSAATRFGVEYIR